ncbi:hypothetical protein [Streptomyces sp. NPDC056480]
MYLKWDRSDQQNPKIDIRKTEAFPQGMTVEISGDDSLTFTYTGN